MVEAIEDNSGFSKVDANGYVEQTAGNHPQLSLGLAPR